jgi:hypothetical protein
MEMKTKQTPRRALKVNLDDGTSIDIELGKHVQLRTSRPAIYIEPLNDGKFRLAYDVSLIPDFCKVTSIDVIREDVDAD